MRCDNDAPSAGTDAERGNHAPDGNRAVAVGADDRTGGDAMISKEEHRKQIIGIAERRLHSLKTDSEYAERLREAMPDDR